MKLGGTMKDLALCVITGGTDKKRILEGVKEALQGGAPMIQLRYKEGTTRELLELGKELKSLCHRYNSYCIVNDRLDVALAIEADGVHLGQDDMPVEEARTILGEKAIIGATCKTVEQAIRAQAEGSDYIGSGAMFQTTTKKDAKLMSIETLNAIAKAITIPVLAIGGITKENIEEIMGTGIAGVAMSSGILEALSVEKETKDVISIVKTSKNKACPVLCRIDSMTGHIKSREHIGPMGQHRGAKEYYKGAMQGHTESIHSCIPPVLTIAGSDCSGGAGIQADLKTMAMHDVYGMSVITALTAQNTTAVDGVWTSSVEAVQMQLRSVFTDIVPKAIKIGMVSEAFVIKEIARSLREFKASNIVVDPVMVATNGAKLIADDAIAVLKEELFPLATILTPNIPEAELLSGEMIRTKDDMVRVGQQLHDMYKGAILLKGGHSIEDANDVLILPDAVIWLEGKRVHNPNTHGTGCTLSSAIASNLAKGLSLEESVRLSKQYISEALNEFLDLGKGSGPLYHNFAVKGITYEYE